MASYLDGVGLSSRLSLAYEIDANILDADAEAASGNLDAMGPFIGEKQSSAQALAFPRTLNPDGSANVGTDPPTAILNAVALLAYGFQAEDQNPPVKSESVLDESITYDTPKDSGNVSRVLALIRPYQANPYIVDQRPRSEVPPITTSANYDPYGDPYAPPYGWDYWRARLPE